MGKDTVAEDPRCESGGGPRSRSHHLVVGGGCRCIEAAASPQKARAGNNYMSSCFPLCSAAAGWRREAGDPPLAEEGSQPNLTCADLCQDAALSLR